MDPYKAHMKKMRQQKKAVSKPSFKKPARKRSNFPIGVMLYALLIAGGAWLGLNHVDTLEQYFSKVNITFLGTSQAQQNATEKSVSAQGSDSERKSITPKSEITPASNVSEVKDINYFKMLEEKESLLNQREKQLKNLESNLQQQQQELNVKVKELEQLRADISLSLKDKVDTDKKTVDKLVQVYANMKPKSAAPVLEKMNEELAVKILHNMKKKNAAAILNVINSDRAKYLTEKIAGYQE